MSKAIDANMAIFTRESRNCYSAS